MFQKAIGINPKNYLAFSNLGALYISTGNIEKAKENLLTSVRIYPAQALTMSQLGFVSHKENKIEEAKRYFEKALEYIKFDYPDTSIFVNYSNLLVDIKEFDHAENILQKGLEIQEKDISLLGNYAVFFELYRNDLIKAEEYYKKSMDVPNKSLYQSNFYFNNSSNYISFLTKQNRIQDAHQIFKLLLKNHDSRETFQLYSKFFKRTFK